jgi:hypothetical protein
MLGYFLSYEVDVREESSVSLPHSSDILVTHNPRQMKSGWSAARDLLYEAASRG